jgi:hypothetical protein
MFRIHHVPIAAREVSDRLQPDLLLHEGGAADHAHAQPGHRRVGDVGVVHARLFEQPRPLQHPAWVDSARRRELHRHGEPSQSQLSRQPGAGGRLRVLALRLLAGPWTRRTGSFRFFEALPDQGDVTGTGPAAAAHHPGPGGK